MKLVLQIFIILIAAIEIIRTNASRSERIVFGNRMTKSELEKFNYQVAIHISYFEGTSSFGGGVLIAPDVVLTAAHVVNKYVEYVVLFMGQTTLTNENAPGGIKISHDSFVVHKYYSNPERYNVINPNHYDIALILLPQPVQLTNFVNTIPLASSLNFDCEETTATAWISGHGDFGSTTMAQNLSNFELYEMRYAKALPLSWDECIQVYPGLSHHRTQLCSTIVPGETGGPCDGDSGGPYAFENPYDRHGKRILCGIVSMGSDCEEFPTQYISVPYFVDNGWICENSGGIVGCDNICDAIENINRVL